MSAPDEDEFRVWIGCLACYNEGRLIGQWYAASEAGEVTRERVHGSASDLSKRERWSQAPHEELWVMDLDNAPPGVTEEMSPSRAQEIADIITEFLDHVGPESDAYFAWLSHEGYAVSNEHFEDFAERYCGIWDEFKDYANELADELIGAEGGQPESFLVRYFDYEQFARDLLIGGDNYFIPAPGGQVYVFRSF